MGANNPQLQSFKAGADLTGKRYHFAKMAAAENAVVAAAAGENAVGVLHTTVGADGFAAGAGVSVCTGGKTPVYAGGNVAIGAKVMANAAGKAVTATATNHVLGVAVTAGADGVLMEVQFEPQGILAA